MKLEQKCGQNILLLEYFIYSFIQHKTFNSGDISALHLLSEIPSFIAVELYQKLVPEIDHFCAFHHPFLLI
jgi:hypothetical protein